MSLAPDLWSYHPKPREDEILSSWLVRTARGNSNKIQTFCNMEWPGLQIWNRDIDTLAPQDVVNTMAEKNFVSLQRAHETTFEPFVGLLFDKVNKSGFTYWINQAGIYHRVRRRPGQQWCPLCLAEDEKPYYRRRWRLSIASTCLKHGRILASKCQNCAEPMAFHRSPDHNCHKCQMPRVEAVTVLADSKVLQLEGKLYSILYHGRPTTLEYGVDINPFIFFRTIRLIVRSLTVGPRAKRLRTVTGQAFGGDTTPPVLSGGSLQLEQQSSFHRHALMSLASRVIEGWPWRYIHCCLEARVYWSWIFKDISPADIPYNLYYMADRFLRY